MVKLFFNDGSKIALQQNDTLSAFDAPNGSSHKLTIKDCAAADLVAKISHFVKNTPAFILENSPSETYHSSNLIMITTR
ncbi:hypothetical protein GKC32_00790 [Lactobacillus curvatus]|nr:hypothetical protein [Latilactobacillus curvatus]MSE23011.1 hypothetical protein [Latilactobacillus curvatus]